MFWCHWSGLVGNLVYLGGNFCSIIFQLRKKERERKHNCSWAQGVSGGWSTPRASRILSLHLVHLWESPPWIQKWFMREERQSEHRPMLRRSALSRSISLCKKPRAWSWESPVLPKALSQACKASWHDLAYDSVSLVFVSKKKKLDWGGDSVDKELAMWFRT